MNQTLFLAEKILVVLGESNQTLEGQLAATEIVVKLLKAEPYGSLAILSEESSGDASQSRHMRNTVQLNVSHDRSHHIEDNVQKAEPP